MFDQLSQRRNLLGLAVLIAAVQAAAYYLCAVLALPDGGMAIPQTDTLLYCQAARRIAEGFPLSFSSGESVSTGTTGVLYPFVLAIPYALGCKGDLLLYAGFFINALFFLVFVIGWTHVIDVKLSRPFARVVAVLLVAAFGQTAYSAFAQSDIGIWLATSSILAAGLATGSFPLYAALLVLGPWVRPEGVVCVIAFCMAIVLGRFVGPVRPRRRDIVLAVFAIMSVLGVFALNYVLTGRAGFSSLAYKGHFKSVDLAAAAMMTAADFMKMAKALFLGLPDSAPRDFYFIPVLGAALLWFGLLARDWRKVDWREYVWFFAAGGGFLTVAQSGWQNTNVDRYIGWILPTALLFIAAGAERFRQLAGPCRASLLPGAAVVLFGLGMAVVHLCVFSLITKETDLLRQFAVKAEDALPRGASIGAWGDCGIVYEMSDRRMCHLSGIYSMEYLVKRQPFGVVEQLKHEPARRFDYWFTSPQTIGELGIDLAKTVGDSVFVGPCGYELLKAKWTAFDAAAQLPPAPKNGLRLKERVDVGYDVDEQASGYEVEMTYNQPEYAPFAVYAENSGTNMIEVGRLVIGCDSMTVGLEPGRDVHVVLRTYPRRNVIVRGGGNGGAQFTYSFANPLRLMVAIDGQPVQEVSVSYADKGLTDAVFTIRGEHIRNAKSRISFCGDHIACAYWYYQ